MLLTLTYLCSMKVQSIPINWFYRKGRAKNARDGKNSPITAYFFLGFIFFARSVHKFLYRVKQFS